MAICDHCKREVDDDDDLNRVLVAIGPDRGAIYGERAGAVTLFDGEICDDCHQSLPIVLRSWCIGQAPLIQMPEQRPVPKSAYVIEPKERWLVTALFGAVLSLFSLATGVALTLAYLKH